MLPSSSRPSARIMAGRLKPCRTNVARITERVKKRIRSRPGKGPPSAVTRGSERAAASEMTPRIPHQATTETACHGGAGSRSLILRLTMRGT